MTEQDLGERGLSPFTLTEIPFTDKNGKQYRMDYVICASTIGEAMNEEAVRSRIDAIRVVSDEVYPPTKEGGEMHEDHEEYIASLPRFATIVDEETQQVIGFHFAEFAPLEGTDFIIWNMHAGGIAEKYQGIGVFERSTQTLLDREHPDIIFGTTIHPSIYSAFRKFARENDFVLFPKEDQATPEWVINLAKRTLAQFDGDDAAETIDNLLVKRNHLRMPVQGKIPYIGFAYFEETLKVQPEDGVVVLLLKPEVVGWAEQNL